MELGHLIPSLLGDDLHLGEFICAARGEVEEGESIKVLGSLIRRLHDLRKLALKGGLLWPNHQPCDFPA